jgi:hypothetical protein
VLAPGGRIIVIDAHHRTASLRWRLAGLLRRFFTLTWQQR